MMRLSSVIRCFRTVFEPYYHVMLRSCSFPNPLLCTICSMNLNNSSQTTRPSWNGLPDVAIKKIFGQLKLVDRARLMLVSKSWKQIMTRDDLPPAPESPWQFRPSLSRFNSNSYLTIIHFMSPSEGLRSYDFKLPIFYGDVAGGWLCGFSSGWVVISAGPKLNPEMFLWNPLSGAIQKLPPLSTLSFLPQLLESGPKECNISSYIKRVHVFSRECVVAVVYSDPDCGEGEYLALCTQNDKKWRVFRGDYFYSFSDILFHDDKLYVLAHIVGVDVGVGDGHKDEKTEAKYMIHLSNCQVEVCLLRLDYKIDARRNGKCLYNEDGVENPVFNITYNYKISEHLVNLSGNLSVMSAVFDLYAYNNSGEGPMKTFECQKMNRIEVRKVDGLERVWSLGEQQMILAETGSLMIAEPGPTCVIFSIDCRGGLVREKEGKNQYVVRETGIYYLRDAHMALYDVKYMTHPLQSKLGWLTPKLF